MFRVPQLSRSRIRTALLIAIAADAIQVLLGPLGWTFFDEVIDIIAMLIISWAIGFHPLLLPTFFIELVPVVDMLPAWTLCVARVISLRKKQQQAKPQPSQGTIIDV